MYLSNSLWIYYLIYSISKIASSMFVFTYAINAVAALLSENSNSSFNFLRIDET